MTIIVFKLLMALEFIVCALLIRLVLIQRSKGQGVGLSFGGGAEAIFGAHMGNVLTRFTVILGIVFLVNTTILAVLRPTGAVVSNSIVERNAPRPAATSPQTAAPATIVEDEDLYSVLDSALLESPAPAPTIVILDEMDTVDDVDTVDEADDEEAAADEAAGDGDEAE